jgi:hypothetical protein
MERHLTRITAALMLVSLGCGESAVAPRGSVASGIDAASAPVLVPISFSFTDVNPCSGLPITVTMTGTARLIQQDGRTIVHSQRTISTSDGFTGRGTDTDVINGNIESFTLNDMLTKSDQRIRAHLLLVVDLTTALPSVRVMKGTFDGTVCVRA